VSILGRLFNRASVPSNDYFNRWYPLAAGLADECTPLSLPSFRAAVDLKGSMVGSLPVYTEVNGRRNDFVPPILYQPDPSATRLTTLHQMIASFIFQGEVVAPITSWDDRGFAQSLTVVDPSRAELAADGQSWRIGNVTLSRFEVLHLVRFPLPGSIRGVGSVQLNRDFFRGVEAQERFQRDFYLNGGTPSVVMTLAEGAGPDELAEARAAWVQKTLRREPVIVPNTQKAEAFQLSNVDQQYLGSKQFTLTEISNIVGLPGAFIGAPNASQTYANINDTRRELVDVYLRPDIVLLEWGFSTLLADGMKAKLDTTALLRTDPMATAQLLTAELAYKTLNEVRGELRLPPVPGGDVLVTHYAPPGASPALPVGNTPALSVVPSEVTA
jgi:HK97 family phage portal protein